MNQKNSRSRSQKRQVGGGNDGSAPPKFTYQPVMGKQVGNGWLSGLSKDSGQEQYRRHLLQAFKDARDRYVEREVAAGGMVPKSIMIDPKEDKNWKTTNPPAPDFAVEKHELVKFGGCMTSKLTRFFTVDQENLKQYEAQQDRQVKKVLKLAGANSFVEDKKEHLAKYKGKSVPKIEEWVDPNKEFRVGMRLKERDMKPIFFYSKDLHDAKYLYANIELYGDQYKASTMSDLIELSSLIEKVTRFQKIMNLMCFAQKKRFVAMHEFQQIAYNMVQIGSQAKEYRKSLTRKWLTNMLTDDEQPVVRSAFRSANPDPVDLSKVDMSEARITYLLKKLAVFIKNRKMNRQHAMSKMILEQEQREATGIPVDSITFKEGDKIQQIKQGQASIILDKSDNYKYITIENKTLETGRSSRQALGGATQENLMKKIQTGDISFISTDLDQTTQFDANNKLNKQSSYWIRLYGRVMDEYNGPIDPKTEICPSQIGYDSLRRDKAKYRVSVSMIKFPKDLAKQSDSKMTFQVKLYQFAKPSQRPDCVIDCASQCIKIKGCDAGQVCPQNNQGQRSTAGIFFVDTLTQNPLESFGVGLVIRKNSDPIALSAERLMNHEEMRSYESQQFFSYNDQQSEMTATLQDKDMNKYEITFSVNEIDSHKREATNERTGQKLLVGRYVIYKQQMQQEDGSVEVQNRVAYVKKLRGDATVDIIETQTRSEHRIAVKDLSLIEHYGVSVFQFNSEPELIKRSKFSFEVQIKTEDLSLLNTLQSKIRIHQAAMNLAVQDKETRDPLSTIEGDLTVAMVEVKGLIVPKEVNRRQMELSNKCEPVVEILLQRKSELNVEQKISKNISASKQQGKSRRDVYFGGSSNNPEFIQRFDQKVNHSGDALDKETKVEHTKKSMATVKRPTFQVYGGQDQDHWCIHIIVRNAADNFKEIGDAILEVDDIIDTNLEDLAREHCVCLNRSHIIDQMKETGKKDQYNLHTKYSGVMRFQTLFQPTRDTCLRFGKGTTQKRDKYGNPIIEYESPKQKLHLEYLLAKSDFDNYKYKIPQMSFNPNDKNFGDKMINLQGLIDQCNSADTQTIKKLLKSLQFHQGSKSAHQQAIESLASEKITDDVVRVINQKIKFQSPFEKLYIIMKLKRKERPFLEQVFFNFRSTWGIYVQDVKNQGFSSLNQNEWYSFIDQLQGTQNFAEIDNVFSRADDAADDDDAKSAITDRSVSFIGETLKEMNNKSNILMKESQRHAEAIEAGNQDKSQSNNFSLLLTPEWEKNGQQEFIDLANLVMCGIPQALRTAAWGDFVRVSLIKIQEKKNLLRNFSQYAGQQGSQISQSQIKPNKKEVLPFQTLLDLSQKFDSIAFRQIDQDISDFKFPAHYYEETSDQNAKMSGWEGDSGMAQEGKISRVNKLKRDKQQMRKLLRVLLVWGKNFKDKGVQYQLSYPTGFLKVVHRFINLMSMEDAFWILIGFIRQFPRLWCLQESSMLDDAKSNYRFELTAIKAIVEVACPSVTQKLYQLGVCIETLVYDSMTCLYCDYFHSETLLRIWDMMFFYFATSERKRGLWLLLAPAILILKVKQQEIEQAKTAKDAIAAYREGLYKRVISKEKQDDCGEDYNPNQIIEGFNEVINEVFVIQEKKPQNQGSTSMIADGSSSIVSASAVQTSSSQSTVQDEPPKGFLANIFSGKKQPIPQQVDQVRRSYQESQNVLFDEARSYNQTIANFLFKNSDSAKGGIGIGKQPVGKISKARRPSEDSMDFENENSNPDFLGIKPSSHTALEYRRWRQDILPVIQDQFLLVGGVPDDDVHEIENTDIYQRNKKLDIRVLYVYLHSLTNFYGLEENDNQFQIQIYYGKLHNSGKFEKRAESEDDDSCFKRDSSPPGSPVLQYFSQFRYVDTYNHVKVNILTSDGAKICHCYLDLKGHQRGKFIYFKKQMNAKEYTDNTESQKATTQISLSLFLEAKKEQLDQYAEDEEKNKLAYLYSLRRPEPSVVNIYKAQKEQNQQSALLQNMKKTVQEEYESYSSMLNQQVAIDMLSSKYKSAEFLPKQKNGHLPLPLFNAFIEKFLPEHFRALSNLERQDLYNELISQKQDAEPTRNKRTKLTLDQLTTKQFIVNTDEPNSQASQSQDQKMFSLRSFVFSVLNQSPLTVKEKLDLLYDITSYSNKSVDGIDMNEAQTIYETVLKQHLYYVPSNELRTQVENVFNKGQIGGITHAYWTSKFSSEVKYDMVVSDEQFCPLRPFLRGQALPNVSVIDVTREIQETFVMYQNLFGNKIIDFNDDTSPFKNISNLFASQEEQDLAQQLLAKTKNIGDAKSKRFRLCILSQIASGERIVTELRYNLQTGAIFIEPERQPQQGSKQFQNVFMKNINVLDLSGGNRSLDKHEFIEGTMRIPLVYDLMRAETFWQDRKLHTNDISSNVSMSSKNARSSVAPKQGALRNKTKFDPEVTVQISVKERNFIFKFVKSTIPVNTGQTQVQELNSSDDKIKTYKIELNCLYNEDIILDMRDKIVNELRNINSRGMTLDQDFISEVEGKMEFQVRKIKGGERENQELRWEWQAVNDFDRVEKFSDDEVFDNEVVFKLSPGVGVNEELLDETPQYLRDGYDCFSIYKHTDNSYEWRPCKIVRAEKKLEFRQMAEAFAGNNFGSSVDDSDECFYHIEFLHNRDEYGKFAEMRVKRRREDVLFSGRYARDQPTFKKKCERFIKETYGQNQANNSQQSKHLVVKEVE